MLLIDHDRPLGFCAGLVRPRVYLSTGARALLDDAALTAVCLFAASVIALLVAVTLLLGKAAHGSATLAPPLLSRQPCIVALALIPAALAALAAVVARRRGAG